METNPGHAALNETIADDNNGGKYLTFTLSEETYGIEILKVREIMGIIDITPIPQSPDHLKGIINLRGKVIPVTDLRLMFSMTEAEYTHKTCIIVAEVNKTHLGIIVDTVSEVLDIKPEEIEEPSNFGNTLDTNYMLGLGKVKEKIVILLDINRILSTEDMALVEKIAK